MAKLEAKIVVRPWYEQWECILFIGNTWQAGLKAPDLSMAWPKETACARAAEFSEALGGIPVEVDDE